MANVFNGDRWVIDTPGAGMIYSQDVFVKSVRWVAPTATKGVTTVVIQGPDSVVRWKSVADDTVANDGQSIENWWWKGFKVPTLDAGILIVDMK